MRALFPVLLACTSVAPYLSANEIAKARLLEKEGDSLGARSVLQKSAASDAESQMAWAEFLDRHRDPGARAEYDKALKQVSGQRANTIARRLVLLDVIAGDHAAARRHYEIYKSTGGGDLPPSILQSAAKT